MMDISAIGPKEKVENSIAMAGLNFRKALVALGGPILSYVRMVFWPSMASISGSAGVHV